MSNLLLILIYGIGVLAFLLSIVYTVGFVRTKDKNAGYIAIALMIVCIISLFYLTFK